MAVLFPTSWFAPAFVNGLVVRSFLHNVNLSGRQYPQEHKRQRERARAREADIAGETNRVRYASWRRRKERTNEREQSVRPSGRSADVGHGFPLGLHLPPLPPFASRTFPFASIFIFVGFDNSSSFFSVFFSATTRLLIPCKDALAERERRNAGHRPKGRKERSRSEYAKPNMTCTWIGNAHVCVRVCACICVNACVCVCRQREKECRRYEAGAR